MGSYGKSKSPEGLISALPGLSFKNGHKKMRKMGLERITVPSEALKQGVPGQGATEGATVF